MSNLIKTPKFLFFINFFNLVRGAPIVHQSDFLTNLVENQEVDKPIKLDIEPFDIITKLDSQYNNIDIIGEQDSTYNNDFMLTHAGMHSYNGNPNPKKQTNIIVNIPKKKLKRKNKYPAKRKKALAIINRNMPSRAMPIARRFSNPNADSIMSKAMRDYVQLVCNPIHNTRSVQIPDYNAKPTYPFSDFRERGNGFTVTIGWDDGDPAPPNARGVLLVLKYGPGDLLWLETDVAYGVATILIDDEGRPIHRNETNWPIEKGVLEDQIWNLIDSTRLVAFGMRVKSNVEMVTDTNSQFVARYHAGQIKQGDLEEYLSNTSEDGIIDILASGPVYQTFGNAQGASARWNPCQDDSALYRFFDLGTLVSAGDNGVLATHGYYYPCIFVEFHQTIDPVLVGLSLVNKPKTKLCERWTKVLDKQRLRKNAKDRLEKFLDNQKDDDDDIKSVSSKFSKISIDHNIKNIKNNIKNLGDANSYTYDIPLYAEYRWYLECQLNEPSPLVGTIIPLDINFHKHYAYLARESNKQTAVSKAPLISDGFSFGGKLMKGLKMINPENTRKAFNWAGGMAREINAGVGDLMDVYQSSIFNSNRGRMIMPSSSVRA